MLEYGQEMAQFKIQIDASVEDGIEQARSRLPKRMRVWRLRGVRKADPRQATTWSPTVRSSMRKCQEIIDKENKNASLFNRRASKDSQLRLGTCFGNLY